MPQERPAELVELLDNVEQLFWFAREQGKIAQGNLERSEPVADADTTERQIFVDLRQLGCRLMGEYFASVGNGDLGYRAEFGGVEYRRSQRQRERRILTVFGEVSFRESVYVCGDGGSVRPFEALVNLPARRSTYFAQDLASRLVLDDSYEDGRDFYADFLGHRWSTRTMRENLLASAEGPDCGPAAQPLPAVTEEGTIGVVSFDGKGIAVVPEERTTGKKREALVACSYTVAPQPVRDPSKLAQLLAIPELLSDKEKEELGSQVKGQQMRYHGSVTKPKEEVFAEVREAAEERFAAAKIKQVVCLMDGATGLWRLAEEHFKDAVYVLDVMHVLGYLWDAANALESRPDEARALVGAWLEVIFQGGVGKVIHSLRIRGGKNRLSRLRRAEVKKAITYLDNHRDYMHYDEYLAQGYPIASGVIESACRHLVKDRMEKAGAQWGLRGAEAVLKLRCLRANGHWQWSQQQRKKHERLRLYEPVLATAA